jgi:hypothetical protein
MKLKIQRCTTQKVKFYYSALTHRRSWHGLCSNFLFTNLFSIKFLYFFIISSLFPYFNLFVSIFIQSYGAMPLSDTFRKAVISIYLQTFVVLLEFLSVGSILSDHFVKAQATNTTETYS